AGAEPLQRLAGLGIGHAPIVQHAPHVAEHGIVARKEWTGVRDDGWRHDWVAGVLASEPALSVYSYRGLRPSPISDSFSQTPFGQGPIAQSRNLVARRLGNAIV